MCPHSPYLKGIFTTRNSFQCHMSVKCSSTRDANIAEFANSVDLDEVAHNEPLHLDLHCLPSSLRILNMIYLGLNNF